MTMIAPFVAGSPWCSGSAGWCVDKLIPTVRVKAASSEYAEVYAGWTMRNRHIRRVIRL